MHTTLYKPVRSLLLAGAALMLSMLFALPSNASSTINGNLYDTAGVETDLAGCYVSLITSSSSTVGTTNTDASGDFSLTAPEEGRYTIIISSQNGFATGDCAESDFTSVEIDRYIEDNSTVTVNAIYSAPGTPATVRGRFLSPSGAPLAERTVTFRSRDDEGTDATAETNSTGRFNATIPAGSYDITLSASSDCADVSNPLAEGETCLSLAHRDTTFSAGTLTDLEDIQFQVGDARAMDLALVEETSPGVFESVSPDSVVVNSYQEEDAGVVKLFGSGALTSSGDIVRISADQDLDWVVDIVAKVGQRVLQGSMVLDASETGSSETVSWDAIDEVFVTTLNVPMLDFVLTEQFDLADTTSFATLDQDFDPTTDNTFTLSTGTTITIPANAVEGGGTANIVVEPAFDIADSYFPFDGLTYNVTVYDTDNATVDSFLKAVTIVMPYDETDLVALDLDETDLSPWFYDEDSNIWKRVVTPNWSIDTAANEITFDVFHFSQYGVVFDRVEDMGEKTTTGNNVVKLRNTPKKVKKVKVQPRLRTFDRLTYDSVKKQTRARGTIGVTFNQQAIADGYQVRFSKKNGKRRKLHRTKKNVNFEFSGKKVKKAKKKSRRKVFISTRAYPIKKNFYLRVRAYNTIGEQKVYGKWSKPKKFRIKQKQVDHLEVQ